MRVIYPLFKRQFNNENVHQTDYIDQQWLAKYFGNCIVSNYIIRLYYHISFLYAYSKYLTFSISSLLVTACSFMHTYN